MRAAGSLRMVRAPFKRGDSCKRSGGSGGKLRPLLLLRLTLLSLESFLGGLLWRWVGLLPDLQVLGGEGELG